MWGDLGKRFFVNTRNNGAVPNVADDAILELRSDMDMGGVNPRYAGEMPDHDEADTTSSPSQAGATYVSTSSCALCTRS